MITSINPLLKLSLLKQYMGESVGPHWVNWSELDEVLTIELELIQVTTVMIRKIQKHIKAAQSR